MFDTIYDSFFYIFLQDIHKNFFLFFLHILSKILESDKIFFHEICFAAEQLGLVNFHFKKGSYGPFSTETNKAKAILSNNNALIEKKIGRMFAISTGKDYEFFKKKYINEISKNRGKIEMITDLFQRIKNTDQAMEVATVLLVERELRSKYDVDTILTDSDIIKGIIEWKPTWEDNKKLKNIYEAIINLNLLGWTGIKIINKDVKKYINTAI